MYLTLEEYIAKRKRKDGLNEFDLEQRVKNMGLCINYVVEYYEKYLDPEKLNSERATQKRRADKCKKQLESWGYESEVVSWVVSIMMQYGKRVDLALKNDAKLDLTFFLKYTDEDFTEFAKDFIEENKRKLPFLEGETKNVANLAKNFMLYRGSLFINFERNFERYNRFGERITDWLKDTYSTYSVNLVRFATEYTSDYFSRHFETEYNRDFGTIEVVREYEINADTTNVFNLDELFEEIKHKPFMQDRKTELELLLLTVWAEDISGNAELREYVNKNRERLGLTYAYESKRFYFVQYRDIIPPEWVNCDMKMVEGHFDAIRFSESGRYLLNTEYSYGRRKFRSKVISECGGVLQTTKDGVPLLWYNKEWVLAFVEYIKRITADSVNPEAIEIYPPFKQYIASIEQFANLYRLFEYEIKKVFPDVKIMICNRNKSIRGEMNFLVKHLDDIRELFDVISRYNLGLKISLDLSQLIEAQAHQVAYLNEENLYKLFGKLKTYAGHIQGIHLFSKMKGNEGRVKLNAANFDSYLKNNQKKKKALLQALAFLFEDNIERYLILETNSGLEDVSAVLKDLYSAGFTFIT